MLSLSSERNIDTHLEHIFPQFLNKNVNFLEVENFENLLREDVARYLRRDRRGGGGTATVDQENFISSLQIPEEPRLQ